MTLQSKLVAAGCCIAIVGSVAGLAVAIGAGAVDRSVARALPSIASAWGPAAAQKVASLDTAKLAPAVLRNARDAKADGPVAGDEGFWLNAKALAGGDGASLAVGDHMSIADRTYVIAELRPIPPDAGDGQPKASRQLMLVVAQETQPKSAAPRTLRFLIDSEQPAAEPTATSSTPAHRTL